MVALEEQLFPARSPADRWSPRSGPLHLSGVQAVLRMLVEVLREDRAHGLRTAAFVSGYQGSPLAGFDRELQQMLRVFIADRTEVTAEFGEGNDRAA